MRSIRVVLFAVTCGTGALGAQTGSFRGAVVGDSIRRPLSRVEVLLPELQQRVVTNDSGRFEIRSLRPGTWAVIIRRVGFAQIADSVHVDAGQDVRREYRMEPVPQQLDSVRVSAEKPRVVSPAMRAFERRHAEGFGRFLTPADMRKVDDRRLTEILRGLAGTTIYQYRLARFLGTGRGFSSAPTMKGGRTDSGMQHAIADDDRSPVGCWVQVILNGARIFAPNTGADVPDIELMEGKEFEAIEFYSGSATTPPEYNGSAAICGTLVLWGRERN